MSEERKLILEMVAQGKITPEEAELLLQAIEEGERSARASAAEGVHERGGLGDLGGVIERAVGSSLRSLEKELGRLEEDLEKRLNDKDLRFRIEERIRTAAERAAARAAQAEERAARHAEHARERAERIAQRTAERSRQVEREHRRSGAHFVKVGVHVDKETVIKQERLDLAAQPGDRLLLDNRVGDIAVTFVDGDKIEVDLIKTVWGTDREDALARADGTPVSLERRGSTVEIVVQRPTVAAFGILNMKDTRIDYEIRLPRGIDLELATKVGDIRVGPAGQAGNWSLVTKVGDIDIAVGADAGFRYHLETKTGAGNVSLPAQNQSGSVLVGSVGNQAGMITATAKTGNIRLHG